MELYKKSFERSELINWLCIYDKIFFINLSIDKDVVNGLLNYANELNKNYLFVEIDGFDSIRDYYCYEFSDKIIVLCKDMNYPTLLNYYENKIISKNQLIEALLV